MGLVCTVTLAHLLLINKAERENWPILLATSFEFPCNFIAFARLINSWSPTRSRYLSYFCGTRTHLQLFDSQQCFLNWSWLHSTGSGSFSYHFPVILLWTHLRRSTSRICEVVEKTETLLTCSLACVLAAIVLQLEFSWHSIFLGVYSATWHILNQMEVQ